MENSTVDVLASIPLFSKLSTRQLRRLLKGSSQDSYDASTMIVREGSRSTSLFAGRLFWRM